LKPEWWGSPMSEEEKYQGKETCDKRAAAATTYQ
jgi:hypothetical protein